MKFARLVFNPRPILESEFITSFRVVIITCQHLANVCNEFFLLLIYYYYYYFIIIIIITTIITSCLCNAIFNFLAANNYIEHEIQKGFTPGLSGRFEHTAQMADIINKACTKQRSLFITLLDLKNAFGEVHHNLIQTALDYHHIPDHVKLLVKNLYTDFKTSVITDEFRTVFVSIGRGILQGDCLSPLLFNLCFNTFLQHIKSEKYRQFGFSLRFLNPIHWFQFADDTAVVSGQESEIHYLLIALVNKE